LCDGDDEYAQPLGQLLGDCVTEGLDSYFYILANGEHKPLEALLLSPKCGEYIRNSALDAIFAQYESGQLPKDILVALVDRLLILYKEQEDFYLLGSLSDLLINYQWKSYQPTVLALCDDNLLESFWLSKEGIENWQASGGNKGVLASGAVKESYNVIDELSRWSSYQPAPTKLLKTKKNKNSHLTLKTVTSERNTQEKKALGRNEPCHCGSGKKYKKCCL